MKNIGKHACNLIILTVQSEYIINNNTLSDGQAFI